MPLLPLVCHFVIRSEMKYITKNFALVLFVLSTTLVLGSTTDAGGTTFDFNNDILNGVSI